MAENLKDAEFNPDALDGDGDGFVQDGTIHERPVEVVVEEVAVVAEEVEEAPAAAAPKKVKNSNVKTSLKNDTVVSLAALAFDSLNRNSASVAAVQTRLIEHGFLAAGSDKRGEMGEGTKAALCEFQDENKIEADTCNGVEVIEALFDKTTVKVLP